MRAWGVTYDTGFTNQGTTTHEPFDPDVVAEEMRIIRHDLHADAVRITGGVADRHAAAAGLEVWYCPFTNDLTADELPGAVRSLVRPLASGGRLVLAFHAGSGVRHVERLFDRDVDLEVVLHDTRAVADLLEAEGLTEVSWFTRGPVAAWGETTERGFVLGRLP